MGVPPASPGAHLDEHIVPDLQHIGVICVYQARSIAAPNPAQRQMSQVQSAWPTLVEPTQNI